MKPTSRKYSSPPSLKCELCRCYTENPIEDFGVGDGSSTKMRGRFCGEHREMVRKIDLCGAVLDVIENELTMRIESARTGEFRSYAASL